MMQQRPWHISRIVTHLFAGVALAVLTGCGGPLSVEKPLRREKISDGVSRKIIIEDKFAWAQSFTRISAETPDGEQRFRVQVRSKQDSILWGHDLKEELKQTQERFEKADKARKALQDDIDKFANTFAMQHEELQQAQGTVKKLLKENEKLKK